MTRFALLALALAGCATQADMDDNVFGALDADASLDMERGESVAGTLSLDTGAVVTFSAFDVDDMQTVMVDVNGMRLVADIQGTSAVLTGYAIETGEPTLMTDADRAALTRLVAALEAELYPPVDHVTSKEEYLAIRGAVTPAEERLFSVVEGLWAQWPSTLPLEYDINPAAEGGADVLDLEQGWGTLRYYANNSKVMYGTHDCNDCGRWETDCKDGAVFGKYFNGANYANCGVSSSGTQYTYDCRDHDQCVRTDKHGGHWLTSLWCDDEFISAMDDEIAAPKCDYDWRGTSYQGSCPSSWDNTNDGCDCFCGFYDDDCSR